VANLRDIRRRIKSVKNTAQITGAINTNLARVLRTQTSPTADYVTVGRKLRIMMEKLGRKVVADFSVKDPVPFADARAIATLLSKQFIAGNYDKVSVAFTRFVNTMSQQPEVVQLLPVVPPTNHGDDTHTNDFLFEPSPEDVLGTILPLYINFRVFQALVEARASEHSARMVAMKSATDNAKKFIKELTLEYNKLRQGAITSELLEITTAMKAME